MSSMSSSSLIYSDDYSWEVTAAKANSSTHTLVKADTGGNQYCTHTDCECQHAEDRGLRRPFPPIHEEKQMKFWTESSYDGHFVNNRMEETGEYVFPHGVRYRGGFLDGQFHGHGILTYPNKGTYEGIWDKGLNISGTYTFCDGLIYQPVNWDYCIGKRYDRRFYTERLNGLRPAELEQLSDHHPPHKLKIGHYDTCDGIYDPEEKEVHLHNGKTRLPAPVERKWIKLQCRVGKPAPKKKERCFRP